MALNVNNQEYSIQSSNDKVIITFNGFLKPDNIPNFLKDYNALKSSVDLKNTILILNGKTLKAFPRELESNLAKLYTDYTAFKKIYIVNPDQIVTKMQIQRVLRTEHIESHFQFIDSVADVK